MEPLVSVVVTTFNQAEYITQALRSVFSQTYKHHEVIVVDDGSTDDTPARVSVFGDRVVYIRQRNQGIAAARNRGIRQARGELVAFLDGDDLWEPEKLSVQVQAAQSHPRSGLVVVDGLEFSENRILQTSLLGHSTEYFPLTSGAPFITAYCYSQLLRRTFIIFTTSQVMVSMKVLEIVGQSDTRFTRASDYDLYLRIAHRYDVTIIKRQLTRWRHHITNASGPGYLRALSYKPEIIEVWKKHVRQASEEYKTEIRRLITTTAYTASQSAYYYGRQVDRLWATRYLMRLLVRNPTMPFVVPFLAALWCPQALASRLGPIVRRMLASQS